jgi:hypothetical protein
MSASSRIDPETAPGLNFPVKPLRIRTAADFVNGLTSAPSFDRMTKPTEPKPATEAESISECNLALQTTISRQRSPDNVADNRIEANGQA